jgi:hypothetical protein
VEQVPYSGFNPNKKQKNTRQKLPDGSNPVAKAEILLIFQCEAPICLFGAQPLLPAWPDSCGDRERGWRRSTRAEPTRRVEERGDAATQLRPENCLIPMQTLPSQTLKTLKTLIAPLP